MIDHVSIGVRDIARSKRFYDAALKPLGCLPEPGRGIARLRARHGRSLDAAHSASRNPHFKRSRGARGERTICRQPRGHGGVFGGKCVSPSG